MGGFGNTAQQGGFSEGCGGDTGGYVNSGHSWGMGGPSYGHGGQGFGNSVFGASCWQ